MIDGCLSISSYTTSRQLLPQAYINPVDPSISFYYMIEGYLSISSYTTSRLLLSHAYINPVYTFIVYDLPSSDVNFYLYNLFELI